MSNTTTYKPTSETIKAKDGGELVVESSFMDLHGAFIQVNGSVGDEAHLWLDKEETRALLANLQTIVGDAR